MKYANVVFICKVCGEEMEILEKMANMEYLCECKNCGNKIIVKLTAHTIRTIFVSLFASKKSDGQDW